ncbi:MAG TPA: hypothetical protein VGR09_01350, partial [Gemmatimonadales bacterium]|nr:hypothetical protein [Gemmatimonadales bacterium]
MAAIGIRQLGASVLAVEECRSNEPCSDGGLDIPMGIPASPALKVHPGLSVISVEVRWGYFKDDAGIHGA